MTNRSQDKKQIKEQSIRISELLAENSELKRLYADALTMNQDAYIKVLDDEIRTKDTVIRDLQAVLSKYVALGDRVQNIDHGAD